MARPAPPRPFKEGKGKREGGCTLFLRDGSSISVTSSRDEAADILSKATLVEFEQNDFSVMSGEMFWVNPAHVMMVK